MVEKEKQLLHDIADLLHEFAHTLDMPMDKEKMLELKTQLDKFHTTTVLIIDKMIAQFD